MFKNICFTFYRLLLLCQTNVWFCLVTYVGMCSANKWRKECITLWFFFSIQFSYVYLCKRSLPIKIFVMQEHIMLLFIYFKTNTNFKSDIIFHFWVGCIGLGVRWTVFFFWTFYKFFSKLKAWQLELEINKCSAC